MGRLLQRVMQMINVPDNMQKVEKSVWWVSWQSTQQAAGLTNSHLHFIEQCEMLIRELQMQCYSRGCN